MDSKKSRSHDNLAAHKFFHPDDSETDLLYFEVLTDNEELCGQSAIPLSSLRTGLFSFFY